jgi:hypothetical protein
MSQKRARPIWPVGAGRRDRESVDLGDGLTDTKFDAGPLGPGMTRAPDAAIMRALRGFDPDRPWKKARLDVLPMLPRLRPYPFAIDEPIRIMLRPGILVGFGVDLGPALTIVDGAQLGRWGVDAQAVATQALINVERLAERCDSRMVVRQRIADTRVGALQTRLGIAASLLLVPVALERFFGPEPAFFVAPMRDLLLAMPPDVDRLEAAWVAAELEELDPNCLHLGGFRWYGAELTPEPLDGAVATA